MALTRSGGLCCHRETRLVMANRTWTPREDLAGAGGRVGVEGTKVAVGKENAHTLITWETLALLSVIFILCNCVRSHRWVGRWDVKHWQGADVAPSLMPTKCSVTRKGEKEQQWNADVCDHGTTGIQGTDKEAFGGTMHSLTAANCFQCKPWKAIPGMFGVKNKRLFQLPEFSFSWWWCPSGSLSFYVAAGLGFWATGKTSECMEKKK